MPLAAAHTGVYASAPAVVIDARAVAVDTHADATGVDTDACAVAVDTPVVLDFFKSGANGKKGMQD